MNTTLASLRIAAASLLICVIGYTSTLLGLADLFPATARGSLITAPDGHVIGSRLIAQGFTRADYFWPRPSAVNYNAAAAGGSNLSAAGQRLNKLAAARTARFGANADHPLPADLAAASGSGLDPDISLDAARAQVRRVASARALPAARVEQLVEQRAFRPGGLLTPQLLVNVLELNIALDALPQ